MKGRAEGMRKNKCGISTAQKWAGIVQIKGGAAGRSTDINKDLVAPDRAVKSPSKNITRKERTNKWDYKQYARGRRK